MKKIAPILMLFVLILSSLACSLGTQPELTPSADEPSSTEPTAVPQSASPTEMPDTTTAQVSNIDPGWYPYVNANVVRDLVVYKGVIHAATLGGLVTWRLDSGYSMQYTPLNGMGHVSTTSVVYCEIPEARILVGTLKGISIYDPNTGLWEERSLAPAESRVDVSKIESLYCDQPNNRLLIGYNGLGVLDLTSGSFQQFTRNEGLLWDSVTDITVSGKDIWIANGYKGVARISGDQVTTFSSDNGLPEDRAYSLGFGKDGTLWVGASSGMMSFKAGKWTLFGADSSAKLNDVHEIEIAADGTIWAATLPLGTGRLCQFNPQTAACDVDFTEMDMQGIHSLTLAENGDPIYGTNLGVYVFQNGTASAFKTTDQLVSNFVDSFASAPDGSLWVGSDAGIQILDPASPASNWTTFRKKDTATMGGNWASGMAIAADGTAWVAFTNGSASRFKNGEWTSFEDVYSFYTVIVDEQGRAWFGDDGKGIIVLNPDGSQAMKLTTAEGLPGDNIQALLMDLSGRIWIGTDQGLAKYENGSLDVVFGKDNTQLPNKYIRALALDADGALVIGTFTGIARYDGNQVTTLVDLIKDGFSEARLTTLAVAPDGRIWAGTDKGLLYSDNLSNWTLLTSSDQLLTNYISALHVDTYGSLWVGGGGSNFDGGGMLQIVP